MIQLMRDGNGLRILGALDGTYIKVNVLASDRPRYLTRKNDSATNVLGVVSLDV